MDADSLSDLGFPERKIKYSKDEHDIQDYFFNNNNKSAIDDKTFIFYVTILFIILSTSYADDFVARLPYCENNYVKLLAKAAIFAIGFLVIYKFLV